MKTNRIIFFITLSFFSLNGIAQSDTLVNQLNRNFKKDGLWIENKGLIEVYYKNGIENGNFKSYYRNGKLSAFGEYTNGVEAGIWYYFDEAGHLIMQVSQINKNKNLFRIRGDGVKITPEWISYVKFYYPSGLVEKEGFVMYDGDIEIDYYETGIWKYYDKQGKFKHEKTH